MYHVPACIDVPLQSGGALSSLVFEYMIDKSKLGIDAGMAQV
jgi:hypothetical protein